jgi:hypothetical protein
MESLSTSLLENCPVKCPGATSTMMLRSIRSNGRAVNKVQGLSL